MAWFAKKERPYAPSEEALAVMRLLDCPSRAVDARKCTAGDVMALYREALAAGRRGGFIPLLVVPSQPLAGRLEAAQPHGGEAWASLRKAVLDGASRLDADALLKTRFNEVMRFCGGLPTPDILGEVADGNPLTGFLSLNAYDGEGGLIPEFILADVPAANAFELPAWVPMGGYGECPPPAEQAAIFRRWQHAAGALPAVVSADTWECFVERPPATAGDALALALEHTAFAPDIVFDGIESIGALADSLKGAPVWFFWWGS